MKNEPNIPIVENWVELAKAGPVRNWGFFSKEEFAANEGRLLMLDMDFGRACNLSCFNCYRRSNIVDDGNETPDLSYDEIMQVVMDAKTLGLRHIKCCGAGEPTMDSRLLRFLRDLKTFGISFAPFTSGAILGNDEAAREVFRKDGVKDALDLCQRIYEFETSVFVTFHSFFEHKVEYITGVKNHAEKRNRALENLVRAGFSSTSPTRLAMVCAPISRITMDEVLDIYEFAKMRNIYPVFSYFMKSGKQITTGFLERRDLSDEEKIDLHTQVYRWLLEKGLTSIGELEEAGVSCMPGVHPCNQVAAGLYVTANGNVTGCPGFNQVIGNVRDTPLKEIWEKSQNFRRRGIFNCHCPPKDGKTIPRELYREVLARLKC